MFDPNPGPGSQIIPRNFGNGPGSLIANLRVSKTFGFGGERKAAATSQTPEAGNRGGERGGGGFSGVGGRRGGCGCAPRGGRGVGRGGGAVGASGGARM